MFEPGLVWALGRCSLLGLLNKCLLGTAALHPKNWEDLGVQGRRGEGLEEVGSEGETLEEGL